MKQAEILKEKKTLESDKINEVSMQLRTDKIKFNQTDDRSIQEIKLPTI